MKKNYYYFLNGSIGDFLMTINLMELIKTNQEDDQCTYNIITPRGKKMFLEISSEYDFLNIIEINKKNFWKTLPWYIINMFQRNYLIIPPTRGVFPLATKIFAKFLAFWPGSLLVGFKDKSKVDSYLYNKVLKYNTDQDYFLNLQELLFLLGFDKKEKELVLLHKDSPEVLDDCSLKRNDYIVIHSFAATSRRSLAKEYLQEIINKITRELPEVDIVLTGTNKDFASMDFSTLENVKILSGLSMKSLIDVVSQSKFYVGVDTGITHIASMLRKATLVIANYGTPNWLPFYNEKAEILYKIKDCSHNTYSGKDHLKDCSKGDLFCLEQVPVEIVFEGIEKMAKKYE